MTKTPLHDVPEIVAQQVDAFTDEEGARLQPAQQIEFVLTGLEQRCPGRAGRARCFSWMTFELEFIAQSRTCSFSTISDTRSATNRL